MSAAVATRPDARAAAVIPANPVERVDDPQHYAGFFGTALIQVSVGLCHPSIEANDVIEVDFDTRAVRGDGLYLLAMDVDGPGNSRRWYGARHFQRLPLGLQISEGDPADGRWVATTPDLMSRITIFGRVQKVFKPRSAACL